MWQIWRRSWKAPFCFPEPQRRPGLGRPCSPYRIRPITSVSLEGVQGSVVVGFRFIPSPGERVEARQGEKQCKESVNILADYPIARSNLAGSVWPRSAKGSFIRARVHGKDGPGQSMEWSVPRVGVFDRLRF